MAFQVNICTMGGESFSLRARDDWSVWDLKRAVEEETGVMTAKQRLISAEGEELDYGTLGKLCAATNGPVQIFLVKMPKNPAEEQWYERWSSEAPDWLKALAHEVVTAHDIWRLREDLEDYQPVAGPDGHTIQFARSAKFLCRSCSRVQCVCQCPPPATHAREGDLSHDNKARAALLKQQHREEEDSLLKTGKEVLAAARKRGVQLSMLSVEYSDESQHLEPIRPGTSVWRQSRVILEWKKSKRTTRQMKATWNAFADAVAESPDTILEPLCNSVSMDRPTLVKAVAAVLVKYPTVYDRLPDCLAQEREVLFVALDRDAETLAEFLQTAHRSDIRDFREWQRNEAFDKVADGCHYAFQSCHVNCRWSSRCMD